MSENISDYAVSVSHLTKSYGDLRALDDVSFSIKKGEILGFLGPNGAGKSTTMRIISGLMPATSGCAFICAKSVANDPDLIRGHIGYMLENNPLPEDMRVIEYLRYRARIKGLPSKTLKSRVDEVMQICNLHRKTSRRMIAKLSKGFRQRVGIADAILAKPDVIIMDEPTIGLDPHQILAIRNLINSLRGEMAVIISSHILPEVELICDKVIIINQGIVVANGTPKELRKEFLPDRRYKLSMIATREEFVEELGKMSTPFELERVSPSGQSAYTDFEVKSTGQEHQGATLIEHFAKNKNFNLAQLAEIKASLEDIFMEATKRSWSISKKDEK